MDNQATNKEILENLSDQNLQHMQNHGLIENYLNYFFQLNKVTSSGITKDMLSYMTTYQKICLLELITEGEERMEMPTIYYAELLDFLFNLDKQGFMTADDID